MDSTIRVGAAIALAGALTLASAGIVAATQSAQRAKMATVSVMHAIPQGVGQVDVLADGRRLARNLSPGQLRTMNMPAGDYDLSIVASGDAKELLSARDVDIPAGADLTITANLDVRGEPEINVFTNKTRTVGQGMGRLTVRHLADAPAVQVRSKGSALFDRLSNGNQADIGLRAGTYQLRISESGARSPLMARTSAKIRNAPGRSDMGNNVIVYIWGHPQVGGLRTTIQEVQLDLN